MARNCEKWWQSSYFFFFFKPATFLLRADLRTDKTRAYPHTAHPLWSLQFAPLMLGVCYNQSVPSPYLSGQACTSACGVYVRLSVCVSVYMCVQSMKETLVSTVHPSPPLILMSPPSPLSLLFSLSISGLINNSLHSPWCLVTFPSHSPPWLPPLTSPVLSSV